MEVVSVTERQTRSDRFGVGRPGRPDDADPIGFPTLRRLSRYDLVLWVIPAVLALGWLFGVASSVPAWRAMVVAGGLALPALLDALAVNPPTVPPSRRE